MAIQKVAHAHLRVSDAGKALAFYEEVVGLKEVHKSGDVIYLGLGADDNYDLAIAPGGTGVERFAFQVDSEIDLEHYAKRLQDRGVSVSEVKTDDPGVTGGIRFRLPSGHTMELVLVADRPTYLHPVFTHVKRTRGFAPLDVDHITLQVPVPKLRETAEFLRDVLDFYISDIFQPAPDVWGAVWTRVGEYHHDMALIGGENPSETLNHLAWQMDGIEHVKKALDYLGQHQIALETGPGRHGVGGNIFAYFWEPGGNRFELSAEMPRTVDRKAPPKIWDNFPKAFSAWGQLPPESFAKGS
ncbi:MAG: Catechol 2,3-dioxygenase [Hydrogenibacillus schlegelii]|uniref:Catechol 2,3-dioxygenase n=1 Tax=Hydrogenibacillus schlegelii TaxID=1484 RepID=A0A2T5G582_HYDSH|nr:VOC family protein [Hydrogenibacillus schlegelii]PTQ51344.1 MAG: Catechol 2,3-dioxygenase [Hydrogenibacillus schlegelii]